MAIRTAFIATFLAALTAAASAQEISGARYPDVGAADQKLSQLLEDERAGRGSGLGMVLVDAMIEGLICRKVDIVIAGTVDGQTRTTTLLGSTRVFGTLAYAGPKTLPIGKFVIASLVCHHGGGRRNFVGPHAKFQVRRGEFADLGTLRLVYRSDGFFTTTGATHRSIEAMNQERIVKLTENAPKLMKKLVRRPMTLIGPAEGTVRTRL